MEAIDFIKETHKPFVGNIDISLRDENGYSYYDYYTLFNCFNHTYDNYICKDCIKAFNITSKFFVYETKQHCVECIICEKRKPQYAKIINDIMRLHYLYDKYYILDSIGEIVNSPHLNRLFIQPITNILNYDKAKKEKIKKLLYRIECMKFLNDALDDEYGETYYMIHCVLGLMDNRDIITFVEKQIYHKRFIALTKDNIDCENIDTDELMYNLVDYTTTELGFDLFLNIVQLFFKPNEIIENVIENNVNNLELSIKKIIEYNEEGLIDYLNSCKEYDKYEDEEYIERKRKEEKELKQKVKECYEKVKFNLQLK